MTPTDNDATRSSDPAELTQEMSDDFRSFVEWILEIDLTGAQEARLHQILLDEWQEDDQETIQLVQGSLATYRMVLGTSPEFQQTWRDENRKTFIASLRDNGEELGQSLLNAYAAEHPPAAQLAGETGDGQTDVSWKSALGMFGAILGGVALAALEERAKRAGQAREEIRRDPEPVESTVKTVAEELADYQRSQSAVQGYMNMAAGYNDASRHIINNIVGDSYYRDRY